MEHIKFKIILLKVALYLMGRAGPNGKIRMDATILLAALTCRALRDSNNECWELEKQSLAKAQEYE
jgi:hypothetical protein